MKRFLILLIVLAGGVAAAAFTVPSNAATVDGTSISQDQLSSDISAVGGSTYYQCYLDAEQYENSGKATTTPVEGAGNATAPGARTTASAAFVSEYLDTEIQQLVIDQLAVAHHVSLTAQDLTNGRTQLIARITSVMSSVAQSSEAENPTYTCGHTKALTGQQVLATMPAPFVHALTVLAAKSIALELDIGRVGTTDADLERFYKSNIALFDTDCISAAPFATEADAEAAETKISAGTSFTAVGGTAEGCGVLYPLISELPSTADLQNLAINQVSVPVEQNGSFYLIEITKSTLTAFATAAQYVEEAAGQADSVKASAAISLADKRATVSVNPRYGTWNPVEGSVLAPVAPLPGTVLNASANEPSSLLVSSASTSGQSG